MTKIGTRPPAPSSRVYFAFGIATAIGLVVFLIWWTTARRVPATGASAPSTDAPQPSASSPSSSVAIGPAYQKGGSLSGWAEDTALAVTRLTQATLVRVNSSTNQVEAWLAESWTVSPDNLVYTFKLRPGLAWSDGTPLSVEDVVQTLAGVRVMGAPLTARAPLTNDALTVEVRFPQPFAPALRVLGRHPILPHHKSADEVGLGPFVEMGPPNGRVARRRFVPNPHYWRKAGDLTQLPYLDELFLAVTPVLPPPGVPEALDFADRPLYPDEIEELRKREQAGNVRIFDLGPGLDADALWLHPAAGGEERPWLGAEAFRLAISTAVDRREYCKQVFFGACDPMAGPVSPANVEWFNPDMPLGPASPDVARGMLAELGLRDRDGDGLLDDAARRTVGFSVLVERDAPASERAATYLVATLKSIGVALEVESVSAGTLRARRASGDFEAIYDRIVITDTDPGMNLDFWLSSGAGHVWSFAAEEKPGGARAKKPDPAPARPYDWERQIDQLMLKNAASVDRIERLQSFVDAQKIYHQHMPAIFFGAPHVRIATSTRVQNATPSPLRPHLLWNADSLAASR